MAERPILFSAPMVRAILAGTKVVTRRVCRGLSGGEGLAPRDVRYDAAREHLSIVQRWAGDVPVVTQEVPGVRCPYGVPGHRLWVRETFAVDVPGTARGYSYRADHDDPRGDGPAHPMRWTPSIHMPRRASRITLEVTSVRVERLQAITEDDARAEGVGLACDLSAPETDPASHRLGFQRLWDAINGKRAGWASNPWVWVVGFRRVEVPRG